MTLLPVRLSADLLHVVGFLTQQLEANKLLSNNSILICHVAFVKCLI